MTDKSIFCICGHHLEYHDDETGWQLMSMYNNEPCKEFIAEYNKEQEKHNKKQ